VDAIEVVSAKIVVVALVLLQVMANGASRVKLIHGLSSTSEAEDLWTTRLGTAYCQRIPFSLIVVALCAVQNSSHLISSAIQAGHVKLATG